MRNSRACILLLLLASAVGAQQPDPAGEDHKLFNGRDLTGWRVAKEGFFDQPGKVHVADGTILIEAGRPGSGIAWQGAAPPRSNYELRLEAKRTAGSDFFCGLTFPVGDAYCTLIVGGWGGGVTGLSNIDDASAVENDTTDFINFQPDKWYRIRLRVTDERVSAWIDNKQMVNVARGKRKFSIWSEQEPMRPLGIATWVTSAAVRRIELQRIANEDAPREGEEPRDGKATGR